MQTTETFLSIKEASRLTGVPAYTLRFWEKEFADFLNPPRTEGGQRRYDQTSIQMVERIKKLVDEEKYSIAGARGVLSLERQQSEQRSDIGEKLRNEAQIDLILDEIAEIVREKVMARLLRDQGNNVVGERVPGLKIGGIRPNPVTAQPVSETPTPQSQTASVGTFGKPSIRPTEMPVQASTGTNGSGTNAQTSVSHVHTPVSSSFASASSHSVRQTVGLLDIPISEDPNA